jgi:NTE family protein
MTDSDALAPLELFRALTAEQRADILTSMQQRDVIRGECLVREGDLPDALFIVLHGSFEVTRGDQGVPIAHIGAGEVVGEIGFFAGTPRTATVTAMRDAAVLELDRVGYERVVREAPSIVASLLAAVSRRLAQTSARLSPRRRHTPGRTVAVVHGGREPIPPKFFERLRAVLPSGVRALDRETVEARFGDWSPDSGDVSRWLNSLEWEDALVVYLADPELTDWTRKCVRQADTVVMVTRGGAPPEGLSPVESFVCEVHDVATRRLVRVHDRRNGVVSGTKAWLDRLQVYMHHHLALEDDADFRALVRFLTGRAIGFVAGGGGAFGPAHVGIYKAFHERGVTFDAFIGTSVGSGMLAGFAMRESPERVDEGTHDLFVTSRGFKRWTWPRYALLDHKAFDEALAVNFGCETLIEDCWHPFFAVATNLSTQRLELIRSGLLWKAVRASCSIPGVLPPVYTEDGVMLVDGGVMDNAPLEPLQAFKSGPNLIVHFGQTGTQRFACRYDDFPGRWELIASLLNPFARRRLPRAPSATSVLMRSLTAHQRYDLPIGSEDLVLRPPRFPGSSFMDFSQHARVFHAAHEWTLQLIDERSKSGDPALAAIMEPAQPPAGLASGPQSLRPTGTG